MTESSSLAPRDSGFDPKRDLLASVVVFLVALPLCIGIAVAVGVSPGKALITGIIGGVIVGAVGGCPLQVCGPSMLPCSTSPRTTVLTPSGVPV